MMSEYFGIAVTMNVAIIAVITANSANDWPEVFGGKKIFLLWI